MLRSLSSQRSICRSLSSKEIEMSALTSVWQTVVGQTAAIDVLRHAVADPAKTAQSWLIAGSQGARPQEVARAFAAALECPQHGEHPEGIDSCKICRAALAGTLPDLNVVTTEKVTISVDEVRAVIENSEQTPVTCPWRIILIEDISRMAERTTNVLLKEVEEPAPRTIWLLCAPSADSVLPTIRSRTRVVTLANLSDADIAAFLTQAGYSQDVAAKSARLAYGDRVRAQEFAADPELLESRVRFAADVLHLGNAPEAILFADDFVDSAKKRAETLADQAIETRQREFLIQNGYDSGELDAKALRKLDPNTRAQYNKIGAADDRKRSITRLSRDVLNRKLDDIATIYRDMLLCRTKSGQSLINEELRADIESAAARLSEQQILDCLAAIDTARTRLNGNGMLPLVFEALLARLAVR